MQIVACCLAGSPVVGPEIDGGGRLAAGGGQTIGGVHTCVHK